MRRLLSLAAAPALAIALLGGAAEAYSSQSGGMEAISIDMATAGNGPSSIAARQDCAEAAPGDVITLDVTAAGIPASTAMAAYTYTLDYPPRIASITNQEPMMLDALPGSSLFNAAQGMPDTDGSFRVSVADLGDNPATSEAGSGVLDRLTLSISADAAPGVYALTLHSAGHIDGDNAVQPPQSVRNANLAIGASCDSAPPPPAGATPSQTMPASPDGTPSTPIVTTGAATPTGFGFPAASTATPPGTPSDTDAQPDGGANTGLIAALAAGGAVAALGAAGWVFLRPRLLKR